MKSSSCLPHPASNLALRNSKDIAKLKLKLNKSFVWLLLQSPYTDYYKVIRIPTGVRHIKFPEAASSSSYLALRKSKVIAKLKLKLNKSLVLFLLPPPYTDYYEVIRIPTGARHIKVQEAASSSSYLALRNSKFKYYLTGGWTVDWPGDFDFAGTSFAYRRPYNMPEYLEALGPTTEELVVEVCMSSEQDLNPLFLNKNKKQEHFLPNCLVT